MPETDEVFAEENRNLNTVEGKIDAVIHARQEELAKITSDLKDLWHLSGDYDFVAERKDAEARRITLDNDITTYQGYKSSPYFARMDFDYIDPNESEDHYESFFIGRIGFTDEYTHSIVIDWRDPIGAFYTQIAQRIFTFNNHSYTLMLKRALNIKNGRLISYNTEYDGGEASLEGDVIDSFLLTVLKDKRRQLRLTDIIRTIQENQNEIIRKPLKESFAVQGCAGSGKTMILLHRLSVLLYNNNDLPLNTIKIITPNRFFDEHISELSRELGLGRIERFSVDEYYQRLINLYTRKNGPYRTVFSEKSINEQVLTELYSPDYATAVREHYTAYLEEQKEALIHAGYREILKAVSVPLPVLKGADADAYPAVSNAIVKAEAKIKADLESKKSIDARLATMRKSAEDANNKLHLSENNYLSARQSVIEILTQEKNTCEAEAEVLRKKAEKHEKGVKVLESSIAAIEKAIHEAEENINGIESQKATYIEYGSDAIPDNNDLLTVIRASCSSLAEELQQLETEHSAAEAEFALFIETNREKIQDLKDLLQSVASERTAYIDYDRMISQSSGSPLLTQLKSVMTKYTESLDDKVISDCIRGSISSVPSSSCHGICAAEAIIS